MIVLADADLERAANAAVYYAMQNAGQTCISVERVYVEDAVHDEFARRVTEKARALRQGDPSGGPGQRRRRRDDDAPRRSTSSSEHVRDAVTAGRRPSLTGGERDGTFFAPTVLTDVDHSMHAMTEETFGPTLPVMRVRDAEEAIRLANDSPYGLAASVFTRDATRGEAIARRAAGRRRRPSTTRSSTTRRSSCRWAAGRRPGLGARHGEGGIRKFCAEQAILVSRLAPAPRHPHAPVPAGRTRVLLAALRLLYGRGARRAAATRDSPAVRPSASDGVARRLQHARRGPRRASTAGAARGRRSR